MAQVLTKKGQFSNVRKESGNMRRFEDFVEGINQEMKIPENVENRFEDTLANIEAKSHKAKRTWVKVASAAMAVVLAGSVVCVTNPALAAKLPIIGNIFEEVGTNVTYSGDYKDRQVLEDGEKTSVKDRGIKLTATEVYSDGYSVFVALKMDTDQEKTADIPYFYTGRDRKTAQIVSLLASSYEINGKKYESGKSLDFEGESQGEHSFVGIIKLDKGKFTTEDGKVVLNVESIEIPNQESEKLIEGQWNIEIPYQVSSNPGKEIVVNKTTENGMTIEKVFVSPYQVVVTSDVPYTKKTADTYTKEMFEEDYGEKNKELIANGEPPVTYEEILNQRNYKYTEIAAFDQNGEAIEWEEGLWKDKVTDTFAVKGRDISEIHFYVSEKEENMFDLVKAKTEKEAKSISDYEFTVEVK